jgi:hypothetical protein
MDQHERDVYDAYPRLIAHLVSAAMVFDQLPLEAMLSANARMLLTGNFIGPDASSMVSVDALRAQRQLIEAAIRLRDGVGS